MCMFTNYLSSTINTTTSNGVTRSQDERAQRLWKSPTQPLSLFGRQTTSEYRSKTQDTLRNRTSATRTNTPLEVSRWTLYFLVPVQHDSYRDPWSRSPLVVPRAESLAGIGPHHDHLSKHPKWPVKVCVVVGIFYFSNPLLHSVDLLLGP